MFQYAAGFSLAKHHNVSLKVDANELKRPDEKIGTFRNYELQYLISPPLVATDTEIATLTRQNFLIRYYEKVLPSYKRKIYNEKQFEFDKNFFKSRRDIYLKGYRQSEKYFLPFAKDIREAFQFKPDLISDVKQLATSLHTINSVSIHVRRGDYTNKQLLDYHGTASHDYYQQAINKVTSSVNKPVFFVFSDNPDWVKSNLHFDAGVEFVSANISKNHYEDFYLMSQCKHNIIANSSFSWWAAWLNQNPDKIVIAPNRWFNKAHLNTSDLIPCGWLRL